MKPEFKKSQSHKSTFQNILIDALTEAITRKCAVSVKNTAKSCTIAITAGKGDITVSLSKMPALTDDIIRIISEALDRKPDLVYNRLSLIKGDFMIYYMVWINDDEVGRALVEKEYRMPENHITYLSEKAISFIQDIH